MKLSIGDLCKKVLNFWLTGADGSFTKLWFMATPAIDQQIKVEFEEYVQAVALNIEGVRSALEKTPRGTLAAAILLDQFPRNIYRNTGGMFQYDSIALELCKQAIKKKFDIDSSLTADFGPAFRVFLYLPFEHSESMEDQENCVQYFEGLVKEFPNDPLCRGFREYSKIHFDIIAKFGRFPHRNHLLSRISTPEEISFLANGGETFGVAAKSKEDL